MTDPQPKGKRDDYDNANLVAQLRGAVEELKHHPYSPYGLVYGLVLPDLLCDAADEIERSERLRVALDLISQADPRDLEAPFKTYGQMAREALKEPR